MYLRGNLIGTDIYTYVGTQLLQTDDDDDDDNDDDTLL